ncbi:MULTISPECIES: carbohydrate ABC transporter permease [Ensifer]|jgi:multiple sugar transport system permease protein|uniref:ABC transporter permease subunit n=1 Tax=Ensifer canadensis TaxID=555315 RepID=A0AAW4FNT6_9HYPH|nr:MULTISPECIES: carbohydrate ABC transporter permease [Ensifer]KQU90353.1 ABC transporter permease [Ensifer sp. Root31]KQW50589.1 ABC transporter permease [Ensifer sp. Root1252]KQW67113.1 ABC transporter permease [Ensifer sp. Root127]KQY63355.1 ABC transporter permease [Ensifer sp. Root142]KRC74812.1 ABC transporter permease [Ensifer sp. Root231]
MKRTGLQSLALYAGVIAVCGILLFPIYWLFVTALSTLSEIRSLPPSFWPAEPQWSTFAKVASERPILLWLMNSTLAAAGSVALSMIVSVFAGYSLSRFSVKGSRPLGLFILTAKMLPATLLVIPLFGIFRSMGLIGSLWSLVLAHSTLIIPFTTWMLKGYFDTIPRELEQAAMVDGCSPLGALFRVVLPVATPGLAATALYAFVLSWADYAYARTFLTNAQGNWTANLGITTMKGEYVTDWNEISAAAVFVALPIVVIYLFLERYLVGGLTAGAEK